MFKQDRPVLAGNVDLRQARDAGAAPDAGDRACLTKLNSLFMAVPILAPGDLMEFRSLQVQTFEPSLFGAVMKKSLITVAIALVSLLGANAFAQKPAPGEDRASSAAKAAAAEKARAKANRKVEGAQVAKSYQPGDDRPSTAASAKAASAEKLAAKAKRKAAGAQATRAPKDATTAAGGSD